MKIFLIESETDNITVYTIAKDADAVKGAERFRNEAGLAKLASSWPVGRLVDIWNSLPGVTPVKKFKDRATAVSRIWQVIQSMGDAIAVAKLKAKTEAESNNAATQDAPQTPDVAPEVAPTKKGARRPKKAPERQRAAKSTREGSKASVIVELLIRKDGATLKELMDATGWQAHSVRGFLSGTIRKKMALNVDSAKREDGQRRYSVIT